MFIIRGKILSNLIFLVTYHQGGKDKKHQWKLIEVEAGKLAGMVGIQVGRRSGGRLATTLVATINILIYFSPPIFSSVVYFSHRRNARIKKHI